MNVIESKAGPLLKMCPLNEMVWKQEYHLEKIAFAITAITLNFLSFPVTILMNVLLIMGVKIRPWLQSKYNILLFCLAGTDLFILIAAASQLIRLRLTSSLKWFTWEKWFARSALITNLNQRNNLTSDLNQVTHLIEIKFSHSPPWATDSDCTADSEYQTYTG